MSPFTYKDGKTIIILKHLTHDVQWCEVYTTLGSLEKTYIQWHQSKPNLEKT